MKMMTWNDLAEQIANMTPKERQGTVIVVLPYDDTTILKGINLYQHSEPLISDGENVVQTGEYYLA